MTAAAPRASLPRLAAVCRDRPLLGSHDVTSLTAVLRRIRGSAAGAEATAVKALRHGLVTEPTQWTDAALAELGVGSWARVGLLAFDPAPSLVIAHQAPATDETVRLALQARDGALVEAVLIPGPSRTTLCVSSQVGCARACSFCETGRHGLSRQLEAGEIVDQVRLALEVWGARPDAPPLRNLVFMGMGEPFDNLPEVLRAIAVLTDRRLFAFAPSHVTVSTVGVADKLAQFFGSCRAELAVSLNAPDDARRDAIMPINRRVPLAALLGALARELPPGRRVLFEYVLFDHFNDDPADADLLAGLLANLRCRVNVIPCNPGPDPRLTPPSAERLEAFVARLTGHGVTTLVRRPRGRDVGGACGQLAGALRPQE